MTSLGLPGGAVGEQVAQYGALPAQRGMILNTLRRPDDGVDIVQVVLDWDEPLHRVAFDATWRDAVRRHAVLRTFFRLHGADGVVQVVDPHAEIAVRWRELPDGDEALERFIRADRFEPLDVARAPMFRVTVLSQPASSHPASSHPVSGESSTRAASTPQTQPPQRIVLTLHHAIMDGRSLRLLITEVVTDYAARRAGRVIDHATRPPFADFVAWWNGIDLSAAEAFWKGWLAEPAMPRPLPGLCGEVSAGRGEPSALESVLSLAESDQVRAAAAAAGVSVNTMVNAAWTVLRGAYGGVDDVVFAVTRSCRHASVPDADAIVGLLINTVPIRVRFDPQWTITRLLTEVRNRGRELREHQLAPLASILGWAGLAADTTLLDSLVVFERQRLHTTLIQLDAAFAARGVRLHRQPSFPVTFYVFDEPRMRLSIIWDRRLLVEGSAQRMLGQFQDVLAEMARRPHTSIASLRLGAPTEQALRAGWNDTARPYPRDATVGELFAAQVARTPHAPAVVAGARTQSYAELDTRTNRLAWALHRHGVSPDTAVAVAVPRGAPLVWALLGVLKAGGAYFALDLTSPPERIASMLAASGARLVLATAQAAAALPPLEASVLIIDEDEPPEPAGQSPPAMAPSAMAQPTGPPPVRAHPLNLAYISYTSGSTGVPKGVAVAHRAIVRLVVDPDFATLGPGERLLHLAPVAFDASTLEIWGALLTGATVVVAPPDPVGLVELAALLREGAVSVLWLTAGLFHQLVEADVAALGNVGQVLAGGDVLSPVAVRAALAARGGRPVTNGYGPTENTTFTTCHRMTHAGDVGERVPIGRPIRQTTVHVLDADGEPTAVGVAGELCTGGDGLARGYLGDAAATARAFVPDPSGHGSRLYRTGDLARWRADGVLEFLGRVDDQVKIRGFRIEPGEVEVVLRAHPAVADSVVVVRGEGATRHLVGYVTPAEGADSAHLRPASLRDFVARRLPDYLVPAGFAVLDRLPLNANGKVDRAALPPPDSDVTPAASPPATATERRLAELWLQLVPADYLLPAQLGRDDSFFTIGGNSLAAARLIFRVRETFGVELGLGDFYQAPTLAACAAAIDAAIEAAIEASGPAATPGHTAVGAAGVVGSAVPAIGRRDRSAYQVTPPAAQVPPHLLALHGDWALWRTVCLRGAGFAADLLDPLADAVVSASADAVLAARAGGDPAAIQRAESAYETEFARATRRLGHALYAVASMPAFREAVAWQNRHALATGVDALLRRDPERSSRNTKHRQHEALVAGYLQRYCAKNDTIGFFGPVGWARFDDGTGIRITHRDDGLLAARTVYLQGWAVTRALAAHTQALRAWLVPRRMPFVGVAGTTLRVPLAAPVALSEPAAAVLNACDGVRTASEVAARVLADTSAGLREENEVFELLSELSASHRLAWRLEVPAYDTMPERTVRAQLARVTDEAVRASALASLDELSAARDALERAAGDPQRVADATAALEATFSRLSGSSPTRRAGGLYAGRTLAYEECLRGDTVQFGSSTLEGVAEPLALVLDSARWFTATGATLLRRFFADIHRRRAGELGTDSIPFADFWMLAGDLLFEPPRHVVGSLVRALQQRWSSVLDVPAGRRRVSRVAADLSARVAAAFPPGPPGWPTAVQHSPDLMIAGTPGEGEVHWVLGELHPGVNTMRYTTWVAYHDDPDALRAGMAADLGRGVIFPAETDEEGGVPARLSNALTSTRDIRLLFANDASGHNPDRSLVVGECDLVNSATGLRVRRRDGAGEHDLMDVVGDLVAAGFAQHFRLLAPAAHTPRVTIDSLVVARESWMFPASEIKFATTLDEARRFVQARSWAATHDLPRHVFVRGSGERKPIYADLSSLASVDLVARAVRRAQRHGGDGAPVTVVEMLPTPRQHWLRDAHGRYYCAELRVVAVDRRGGRHGRL